MLALLTQEQLNVGIGIASPKVSKCCLYRYNINVHDMRRCAVYLAWTGNGASAYLAWTGTGLVCTSHVRVAET